MRSLAKHLEIQKTGWSAVRVYSGNVLDAHCEQLYGLPVDTATNRREVERAKLCPADKRVAIEKAFEHFWHASVKLSSDWLRSKALEASSTGRAESNAHLLIRRHAFDVRPKPLGGGNGSRPTAACVRF
jgi:hypothetical protein